MNGDLKKRKKRTEIQALSKTKLDVTALYSDKPLYNLVTSNKKSMDVAKSLIKGNPVPAPAPEVASEEIFFSCAKKPKIKEHAIPQPGENGCGRKPIRTIPESSTWNKISQPLTNHNVSNGYNNGKKKRTNYIRDSSYWTQKTGKTKCPLNYEPDSDYWSYLSSSECSYNHKGSPGFEDLKVSGESESK